MPMLDLKYNPIGKFYEAPLQMKANGGIFMIDDFGRQQVRAMDLLNRWIVPLEKTLRLPDHGHRHQDRGAVRRAADLLDQPRPDAAGRRGVPAADQVQDRGARPDASTSGGRSGGWCARAARSSTTSAGIDYLIEKWYKPTNRPFRMCQPRDILDQMISIAKYNMERVNFSPDLIDAACATYFIATRRRTSGRRCGWTKL